MKPSDLIRLYKDIEQLKNITRHSWTSKGRKESVAEHCFSSACLADRNNISHTSGFVQRNSGPQRET